MVTLPGWTVWYGKCLKVLSGPSTEPNQKFSPKEWLLESGGKSVWIVKGGAV